MYLRLHSQRSSYAFWFYIKVGKNKGTQTACVVLFCRCTLPEIPDTWIWPVYLTRNTWYLHYSWYTKKGIFYNWIWPVNVTRNISYLNLVGVCNQEYVIPDFGCYMSPGVPDTWIWPVYVTRNSHRHTMIHMDCTALHCNALHGTVLHWTELPIDLSCTSLHIAKRHCTALYCTEVQCSYTAHCTVPKGTKVHYNTLLCRLPEPQVFMARSSSCFMVQ